MQVKHGGVLRLISVLLLLILSALVLGDTGSGRAQTLPGGDWSPAVGAEGDNTYVGFIDEPASGGSIAAGASFAVTGWVVDSNAEGWSGIDDVQVLLGDTMLTDVTVGEDRPDVADVLGDPDFASSGFSGVVAGAIAAGTQTLTIMAHTPDKGSWSKQVTVEVTGATGSLTSAAATPSDTTPTPTKTANSAPTVRTTSSTRTSTAAPMPTGTQAKTYTTTFPLTENPISERGHWVGGSMAGGNLWGDVQTAGDRAFGVSQATTYGDPTAILTGTWGPNQTASAVVSVPVAPTGPCCHEVEVRLRMTISPNSITGYEVFCSVMPGDPYIQIARWNGANGSYLILKGGNAYCAN